MRAWARSSAPGLLRVGLGVAASQVRLCLPACPALARVLRQAYQLRASTPAELQPCLPDWAPLPATGAYTEFTDYPPAAVELFAQVGG